MKHLLIISLIISLTILTTSTAQAQTPYSGTPVSLPGKIEAENFDLGGQNIAYYDTTPRNHYALYRTDEDVDIGVTPTGEEGSYVISWFHNPEWLKYSVNITQAGTYEIGIRNANQDEDTVLQLLLDDQPLGDLINIPDTGNWNTFQTTTVQRDLPAGNHILTLKVTQNSTDSYASNVDYLTFTLVTPSVNPDGDFDFLDLQDILSLFNQLAPFNYAGGALIDIFDFNYVLSQILTPPPTPTNTPVPSNTPVPPPITNTPTPTQPATATPTATPTTIPGSGLTIDLSTNEGPVTYRATGTFGDQTNDAVFNTYWAPLKFQLFSWIAPSMNNKTGTVTFPGLARAQSLNAYYQSKVRGPLSTSDLDNGMSSNWAQTVQNVVRGASNTGYSKIQVDIFNEPIYNNVLNSNYLLTAWRLAYDSRELVDPNVTLSGPNINHYSGWNWLVNTFLPTMNAENKLPDVITWHEINTNKSAISNNIQTVRTMLDGWGRPNVNISINEYNYTNSHLQPGLGVQFISEFEDGRVQSASRACWDEPPGGSYDCVPTINSLLTLTGVPRSIWHTYKAYADMTGNMVAVSPTTSITGVASVDNTAGSIHVLIGRYTNSTNAFSVQLQNLQSTSFDLNQPIAVTIYQIPNSGSNELPNPIPYEKASQTFSDNQLTLSFPIGNSFEAYHLILTQ